MPSTAMGRRAALVCAAAVMAMVSHVAAFTPGATKVGWNALRGNRLLKPSACRAKTTSLLPMRLSDEEFGEIVKAGSRAPEGSPEREKWLAALKIRQKEMYDRSMEGPKYVDFVQKFKDENPAGWKAAQLVWLFLVVGVVVFPGAFTGMFGGQ